MPTDVPQPPDEAFELGLHWRPDEPAGSATAASRARSARREARRQRAGRAPAPARRTAAGEPWARDPTPAEASVPADGADANRAVARLAQQVDDLQSDVHDDLSELRAELHEVAASVAALYAATEDLQRWVLENAKNVVADRDPDVAAQSSKGPGVGQSLRRWFGPAG